MLAKRDKFVILIAVVQQVVLGSHIKKFLLE